MALDDEFLADLDELSSEEHAEDEGDLAQAMDADQEDDIDALDYENLRAVAKLTSEARYQSVMQRVRDALEHPPEKERSTALLEDDPTYKLLVDCNRLAVDIDNEMAIVHNFIRDKYRMKFPELESLVHHPEDYAKVVERIGNEMDLTLVELEDLLPAATIMVVTVTATTTSGQALAPPLLDKVREGCAMMRQLEEDKGAIICFVEGRMQGIAPNLSAAVGSEVAARLMGVAGGLLALSRMPACNVQVLGAKRKNLAGLSAAAAAPHQGFIYQSPVMATCPPSLRPKAARMIGAKCTLMARVDAYGQDPAGVTGQKFLAEMQAKISKWQEPPPAKQIKPLPAPDAEVKKRRGGRRLRKMKERYGLTDMRKEANRMNFDFAKAEEEYIDGDEIIGLGNLGAKEGTGRLRVVANQQKVRLTQKQQKKYKGRLQGGLGNVSGLASSLTFTPVQGFDLGATPGDVTESAGEKSRSGLDSYFSTQAGFRSLQPKKGT